MIMIGNVFMSLPDPSFSYGWYVVFSLIISVIMWNLFNQGLSLLQELEEKHLKEEHQRLILEKEIILMPSVKTPVKYFASRKEKYCRPIKDPLQVSYHIARTF